MEIIIEKKVIIENNLLSSNECDSEGCDWDCGHVCCDESECDCSCVWDS